MQLDHAASGDRAESLFRRGFSCSQSVLMAFAPGLGIEERQAALVAAAFGGGMGRQGLTCGALAGALMVLGLKHGHGIAEDGAAKDALYARVQALAARFEQQHGASTCRELTGVNMLDPTERQAASERGVFTTLCPQLVRTAATLVAEEIDATPSCRP